MLGLILSWLSLAIYFPPNQPSPSRLYALFIAAPLIYLLNLLLPLSFAFSILRYRLWDIDLLIRRTVSYALITGILAALYFGGVVLLQSIFQQLTGQADSPLVTVLSTLGIAAVFNPLRTRTQDFIDRRFYRSKYDAEQTLARFATAARSEIDLETLSAAMLNAVQDTMQPESVALWMMQPPKR